MKDNTMLIKLTDLGIKTADWVELSTQGALRYVKLPAAISTVDDATGELKNTKVVTQIDEMQNYYNKLRKCYGEVTKILAISIMHQDDVTPIQITICKDRYDVTGDVAESDLEIVQEIVDTVQRALLGLAEDSDTITLQCDPTNHMCVTGVA